MSIASLLYDEFKAYAPVRSIDTNGDWLTTYPSSVTVFGRYQSVNSSELIQGDKFVGKLNPVVYLPPDSSVDLNWKLERVSDGRIMRVTRIEAPSVAVYKKYICEETQEE